MDLLLYVHRSLFVLVLQYNMVLFLHYGSDYCTATTILQQPKQAALRIGMVRSSMGTKIGLRMR